jgi:site-specific DNA recombinase
MPSTNGHGPKSEAERVALYLRVSSEEQVERESIVTQDDFLKDYCKLYGLKVAGVYRDDGVSGTVPMHERPGGRHLLEDAKEGKFEAVLVYKLDRIGRTLLVVLDAHDRLGEAEVALRSATEPNRHFHASGEAHLPDARLLRRVRALYDSRACARRDAAGL